MFFVNTVSRFVNSGAERTVLLKKNILGSFVVKGLAVVTNFLIVPITVGYVDEVRYGVWVTLTSIVTWMAYFDFGMGNGLRNKLTTALARGEFEKAQKYISTTYVLMAFVALLFFILFSALNSFVNWNSVFNIPRDLGEDIHLVVLLVVGTFCLQFSFQLLNTVLRSMQEPAKAELLTFFGQFITLLALLIIRGTVDGSLRVLVLALNVAPVAVLFVASLLLYRGRLKTLAPSLKKIDLSYAKSILNLGGVFFLIQIGSLVLHQTDNLIITNVIGPGAVTKFNVTFKLYSVIIAAFTIITAPFWSAFTDAFAKEDYTWISKNVQRLRRVWAFTALVVIPSFFLVAKFLLQMLFPKIEVSTGVSLSMAAYIVCFTGLSLNCYLLYGAGKLKVLMRLYLVVIIANVPLGVIMGRLWGIEGVIIANIVFFSVMNIVLWIQNNKILSKTAAGIWNA